MRATVTDATALQAVTIADLAAYLRATGWAGQTVQGRPCTAWTRANGGGETFELEVPARADFLDYRRRISEALITVSVAESRSQLEILQDIRRAQVDVLRVRLEGPTLATGRLPLDGGSRVVARVRDALLAAACAVVEPRPSFATRKPDAAMAFVRAARLAPPEMGSHVVLVEAPLPPNLQVPLADGITEEPFERRTTLLLARALQRVRSAASTAAATGDAAPFLDGAPEGLSSNLCDAVAEILTDSGASTVTFAQSWATSRPVPLGTPNQTRFLEADAPFLRAGARVLRERGPQVDFEIEGQIIRLDSEAPEAGGVATVAATVDGRIRRVKVRLDAADYQVAISAHGDGQMFACEGELVKEGGSLVLKTPRRVVTRGEG